ncbi:MAG: PqiC family protein [Planctomycetota bacterium]|jgi:uncharacterized lipoprotein YmbA
MMRVRSLLLYAALPLVVAACRSEPANFYLLTPVHHPSNGSDTQTAAGPWVGIGPITLPQYLDRPQIVIRAAAGAVTLGEFDQWAESLQDGLSRVIGENLAVLLPTDRVTIFPWRRATAIDYQIVVQVIEFDAESDGAAVLAARWAVMGPGGNVELLRRQTRLVEPANSRSYADIVAAMSRAVGSLSGEIVDAIKSLRRTP